MYKDKDEYRKYQREWQLAWRKKHPRARDNYPRYCSDYRKPYNTRMVTSIVELKEFMTPKQIQKIIELRKVKKVTHKERVLGSNRCQVCEIKVGKGHEERKLYPFRGKMLCGECYDERNKHYN